LKTKKYFGCLYKRYLSQKLNQNFETLDIELKRSSQREFIMEKQLIGLESTTIS
jgi:hypothetical protein